MSALKLEKAYNKYGASLGRAESLDGLYDSPNGSTVKLNLRRVDIDSQGYDNGGAYWGHSTPLYVAFGEAAGYCVRLFTRADNREQAAGEFRRRWQNLSLKFYGIK